jgi:RNA polymerase sigma-70 factor (ECF subfamily)
MSETESTCWTVIQAAAAGGREQRESFARRYAPVVRSYLAARWQGTSLLRELEDAAQEVFVECFKDGGVLDRADRTRPNGFRPFLYSVVRNVALRVEDRAVRRREEQPAAEMGEDVLGEYEARLSAIFDRAWAQSMVREAVALQARLAREAGGNRLRRVEILHLRFYEGMKIREIAALWKEDAAALHREYRRARFDFQDALSEIVAFHHPGSPDEIAEESAGLLALLE